MAALTYPSEFKSDASTDYIMMQFIRRDYTKNTVVYEKTNLSNIVLNVPQKITETFTQNFQNAALGELGILNGFGNRQNVKAPEGAGALGNMLKRVVENTFLDKAVELGNKMGASGLSANGLLSGTSGIVFNPNLEVLYEGPDFRTFNFQFSLFTKSKKDAQSIKLIVDTLRQASLPSRGYTFQGGFEGGLGNLISTTSLADGISGLARNALSAGGQLFKTSKAGKKIYGGDQGDPDFSGALEGGFKSLAGGGAGAAAAAGVGTVIFSGTNRFITQPPLIYLRYMRGANVHPFLQPLLPSFINQVGFDFTPTGSYTQLANYADALAKDVATTVGVNITLQLTEVSNIYSDDYENGQLNTNVTLK